MTGLLCLEVAISSLYLVLYLSGWNRLDSTCL